MRVILAELPATSEADTTTVCDPAVSDEYEPEHTPVETTTESTVTLHVSVFKPELTPPTVGSVTDQLKVKGVK